MKRAPPWTSAFINRNTVQIFDHDGQSQSFDGAYSLTFGSRSSRIGVLETESCENHGWLGERKRLVILPTHELPDLSTLEKKLGLADPDEGASEK